MKKIIFLTLFLVSFSSQLWAQRYPERREVRRGNKSYHNGEMQDADLSYRKVLATDSTVYEANFNLADVLYRQKNYDQAVKILNNLSKDTVRIEHNSKANYNLGNVYFQQKELEKALEAYKQALRVDPGDEQARFNLAYTQKLLEQEQNQDQQQQEQNQDQNQDQQDQDQNQDEQQQNQDQNQQQNQDEPQQQAGAEIQLSPEEAERMLEALQMSEDKTREKVDKEKAKGVVQSGKNW
ncbi:MAG: tetratricopeptide repeat protein [Rikenellaceae bacterium]